MHSLYDGNLTYQKVVRRLEFHRLVERGIVSIMNFQFGDVLGTLRSQIEGYTRLLIFRKFSTLPAVI